MKSNTINQTEFSKFGFQSNIIPGLISNSDLLFVFRSCATERMQMKNNTVSKNTQTIEESDMYIIDFDFFKKSFNKDSCIGTRKTNRTEITTVIIGRREKTQFE